MNFHISLSNPTMRKSIAALIFGGLLCLLLFGNLGKTHAGKMPRIYPSRETYEMGMINTLQRDSVTMGNGGLVYGPYFSRGRLELTFLEPPRQ